MADDTKALSPRARQIATLLSQVSNVTIPKPTRREIADALAWELGENATAEDAWNMGVACRWQLGWSSQSREAWHQLVSGYQPLGVTPTLHDWLRVAGYTLDDGSENLPDSKRAAPGARRRITQFLDGFLRGHGVPVVSRQETADDRKPYVD